MSERFRNVRRTVVDRRPVCTRAGDLHRARGLPHDDERIDPFERGRIRERLRVVTGGDRDHAVRLLLVGQRRELVEDSAGLEGARTLEQLRLEQHRCADTFRQRAGREHRRAMQATGDALAGGVDVVERRQLRSHGHRTDRTHGGESTQKRHGSGTLPVRRFEWGARAPPTGAGPKGISGERVLRA